MSKIAKFVVGGAILGALVVVTGGVGAGFFGSFVGSVGGVLGGAGIYASAGVIGAVAGGILGGAIGVLAPIAKPSISDLNQQAGQKFPVTGNYAPYRKLYGKNRVAGDEVFITAYDSTGGDDVPNDTLVYARVVAPHPINDMGVFKLGDTTVSFSGNNATGKFAGHLYRREYTGSQTTADSFLTSASNTWTSDHKLTNQSYFVLKATFDSEVFPYGIGELRGATVDIEGALLYDPRKDSTQTGIGGSGSHRANDPTTWEYSRNPALVAYDILKDSRLGVVVPDEAIEISDIVALANHCDENVTVKAGGTIKRYLFDGMIDCTRSKLDNIKMVMTSCCGRVGWEGGKVRIYGSYMTTSVFTLTADHIKAVRDHLPLPPQDSRFNTVKGNYIDPDEKYSSADYPAQVNSASISAEGEIPQTLNLPYTQDYRTAQRLAKIELNRSELPLLSLDLMPVGLTLNPWDIVTVDYPKLGISSQTFRVLEKTVDMSSGEPQVSVQLQADAASTYAWTAATDELDRSAKASITEANPSDTIGQIYSDILDTATEQTIQDPWFNKQAANLSANKAWTATSGWSFPTAKVELPTGKMVKVAQYSANDDEQEFSQSHGSEERYDGARLHNKPFFISSQELIRAEVYGTATVGTNGKALLGLSFYNDKAVFIEERINDAYIAPTTTGWGLISRLITAPPGAAFAEFFIIVQGNTTGTWKFSGAVANRLGRVDQQNIANLDGGQVLADVLTADSLGQLIEFWDFAGDAIGWTSDQITDSHTEQAWEITTTGNDAKLISPSINVDGSKYNLVYVRMKRRSAGGGSSNYERVQIYYKTVNHNRSGDYRKVVSRTFALGEYIMFAIDMHQLTAGGDDWATSYITQLWVEPTASTGDQFDIDWIGIGRASIVGAEIQTINLAGSLQFTIVSPTDTGTDATLGERTLDQMGVSVGHHVSASMQVTAGGTRRGRVVIQARNSGGTILKTGFGSWQTNGVSELADFVIPSATEDLRFILLRENTDTGISGTIGGSQLMVVRGAAPQKFLTIRDDVEESANNVTDTNQLTDGANLGGTAAWDGVTGAGKPADNATQNNTYVQTSEPTGASDGDLWLDTSATPSVWKVYNSSSWVAAATLNTGALADENIANVVSRSYFPSTTITKTSISAETNCFYATVSGVNDKYVGWKVNGVIQVTSGTSETITIIVRKGATSGAADLASAVYEQEVVITDAATPFSLALDFAPFDGDHVAGFYVDPADTASFTIKALAFESWEAVN